MKSKNPDKSQRSPYRVDHMIKFRYDQGDQNQDVTNEPPTLSHADLTDSIIRRKERKKAKRRHCPRTDTCPCCTLRR